MTDIDDVRTVNQRFYDAHEARDLDAMGAVWEQSERIACVHPGWQILRGWDDVLQSWAGIFRGPGRNQFILTNDSIEIVGDTAWVTLDENLVDQMSAGTIAATNIFVRDGDGRWKMVAHHGSPVMSR